MYSSRAVQSPEITGWFTAILLITDSLAVIRVFSHDQKHYLALNPET
jgi:hypothetical protein